MKELITANLNIATDLDIPISVSNIMGGGFKFQVQKVQRDAA